MFNATEILNIDLHLETSALIIYLLVFMCMTCIIVLHLKRNRKHRAWLDKYRTAR